MTIPGFVFSARFFDGTTLEQAFDMMQCHFAPLTVHAKNTYAIHRNFLEGYRGYMIGKGFFKDPDTGIASGRSTITIYDDFYEETGRRDEISFSFKNITIYGALSRRALWCNIVCRDAWTKELRDYLYNIVIVRDIEVRECDYSNEINLFYSDLARRLEEGDFEGGDNRSGRRINH